MPKKLEKMIILSKENGAKLAVSSELAISGYPPRDLLNNDEFLSKAKETTEQVNSPIPSLIGIPLKSNENRHLPSNAVMRIENGVNPLAQSGESHIVARKILLPTYDVFDEVQYLKEPGTNLV